MALIDIGAGMAGAGQAMADIAGEQIRSQIETDRMQRLAEFKQELEHKEQQHRADLYKTFQGGLIDQAGSRAGQEFDNASGSAYSDLDQFKAATGLKIGRAHV